MRAVSIVVFVLVANVTPLAWGQGVAADITGSWPSGHWYAERTGHTGPLRAEISQAGGCQVRAVFSGRFARIVPFRYVVRLNIVGQEGDKVLLGGSSWLPLFGRFEYSGHATGEEFIASFKSRSDHGTFVLKRCPGTCQK